MDREGRAGGEALAGGAVRANGAVRDTGVRLELNVPFYPGAVPGMDAVVAEDRRATYVEALAREVRSAAGDAAGRRVERVAFVGGTPANMTLAAWCGLMDDLRASFPGSDMAHLRFDVAPELVNTKTAQYAFRYRTLFNLVLETVDERSCAAVAQARETLLAEKLDTFGVQVDVRALGEGERAERALEALVAERPAFVRATGAQAAGAGPDCDGCAAESAPVLDERGAAVLAKAGFKELERGLFCRLGRSRQWFSPAGGDVLGFGLGSRTALGGEVFSATDDVELYIEKAGLSDIIYECNDQESPF